VGSPWADGWAAALLLVAPPLAAQQVREIGLQATITASDPALVIGGVYAALRTSLRTRVSVAAGAGAGGGDAAWRGELLAHFLLNPDRQRGAGVYGAGGLAVVGGPVDQGYLVLTLGLEAGPGGRSGWFVEGGVGGGVRLAAGYRWRKRPAGLPALE
jgi:hypothetical protein